MNVARFVGRARKARAGAAPGGGQPERRMRANGVGAGGRARRRDEVALRGAICPSCYEFGFVAAVRLERIFGCK